MKACPHCATPNSPDLVRCRSCDRYLWGGRVASALFSGLPPRLARSPGVATCLLGIVLVYVACMGAVGIRGGLAFSGYSLRMLGAMHPPAIVLGEYWRFVSSAWLHGDLLHLLFNAYALLSIGPLLERAYGKRRFLVLWFVAGAVSMIGSFGWSWLYAGAAAARTSVGASGAICGLIGAMYVVAFRLKNTAAQHMIQRWGFTIILLGVAVPGIDNAAHLTGGLAGAFVAYAFIWRDTTRPIPPPHRGWQVMAFASGLAVLASFAFVGVAAADAPVVLERDAQEQRLIIIPVRRGTPWASSTQYDALIYCERALERTHGDAEQITERCEPAARMVPQHVIVWDVLALAAEALEDGPRAARLRRIAERIAQGNEAAVRLSGPSTQEGSGSSS